jgi:3-isopropylmalate/(R)-2-methylmalate dehydratase large subunit
MGMTISEKILAEHAGKKRVKPGEIVEARLDFLLANDITAPLAIESFKQAGGRKVFDRSRLALVLDHFVPAKDIKSAEQAKLVREFARRQKIKYFYETGCGIEHALLPQQGLVSPGELLIGADSHTCTYGALGAFATGVGSTDLAAGMLTGRLWLRVPASILVDFDGEPGKWLTGKDLVLALIGKLGVDGARYMALELTGSALSKISIYGRFTICNMAIEAGAKNGIIAPDKITRNFIRKRLKRPAKFLASDPDASYAQKLRIDVRRMEPQVAVPSLPENVQPVSRLRRQKIDQVVIGSCTNGWLEDLRLAAEIMDGKQVHPDVRLLVLPATREIYLQALKQGILEKLSRAGAVIGPPTCGPCLGGHMGVLAEGERCLATTNRNFIGRMGSPKSEVYLCGPAVAAASAVLGRISSPEEL